tara:strand:+ start:52 stop:447 length:396 start_codon:yes stop_codon:yes gene_type:complete
MKKSLRLLANTFLFIALYLIIYSLFIEFYYLWFWTGGPRPTNLVLVGNLFSLIISFPLVWVINKSKLWLKLFKKNTAINNVKTEVDITDKNKKMKENSFSSADEITKLHELKEKGILSEEEFQREKTKIIK